MSLRPKTLSYIIDHVYPPQFVGFIVNYPKSSRFVKFEKLKELLNVEKNCKFVCVLVKPYSEILLKLKISFIIIKFIIVVLMKFN